jgi:hypothetical protein
MLTGWGEQKLFRKLKNFTKFFSKVDNSRSALLVESSKIKIKAWVEGISNLECSNSYKKANDASDLVGESYLDEMKLKIEFTDMQVRILNIILIM